LEGGGDCVEGDSHGLINMQLAKYLSASLQNMLKPIQDRLQAVLKNNKAWSEHVVSGIDYFGVSSEHCTAYSKHVGSGHDARDK
jgi:hypothetical protein